MASGNFGTTRTVITMDKKLLSGLVVALVVGSAWWAWGDTISWTFSTAGNYTASDATKVEVANGVARLIAVDQTDNDSTSTGFGGGTHNQTQWNSGNNWLELQAGQTSGDFISRVMDAGTIAAWNSISWVPQRPFYKELPDNKGVETAYPTGNADMTGNVLLMHMNEASGTIVDYSGEGNDGTTYGGATYGTDGKFNTALSFDGVNDYIQASLGSDIGNSFTMGAWFYADSLPNDTWQGIVTNADGEPGIWIYGNRIDYWANGGSHLSADSISTNTWYHVAIVFDGSNGRLYINGQLDPNSPASLASDSITTIKIGSSWWDEYYRGIIDEVSIWDRTLSASEILDHYKRGVLRLKYQVRSGSTNPPTGNFIGPDGTTGTYYSELSNSTTGLPSLSLTNVSNNRYFQYKAYLETGDSSYSPELKSVVIGPAHYPEDNPTVQNNTWQTYDSLSSFSETLGAGNVGSVKYQISNDGTNWYYWNGSNWVAASGYSQTNTALEVNTNCGQFDDDVGRGDFYFKAFLHSDGAAQQVELDQVDLGYTSKTSVSVSDSTFTFGTNPLNTWMTPQTSVITNDGNVAENLVGRISQFTDGANSWGISSSVNGDDIIRAQWSATSEGGPWTDVYAYNTDFTIATDVAVNDSVNFWFRIQTPTSTSSSNEHSSALTVTAQEY
jgi:hypothetical protein